MRKNPEVIGKAKDGSVSAAKILHSAVLSALGGGVDESRVEIVYISGADKGHKLNRKLVAVGASALLIGAVYLVHKRYYRD